MLSCAVSIPNESVLNERILKHNALIDSATLETVFQKLIDKSKEMPAEIVACWRRYAIENNINKLADYNIDLSNVTSYDCELTFTVLDNEISVNKPNESIVYLGIKDRAVSDCKNKPEFASQRMLSTAMFEARLTATFDLSPEQQRKISNEVTGDIMRSQGTA